MHANFYTLAIFAPILIIVGILGFVIPPDKSLTSGAPAYNIFHIVFGLFGLGLVFLGDDFFIRTFNIAFGLIDLYQLFASFAHMLPESYFRWTRVDDFLHLVIGAGLLAIGVLGS